MWSSFFFKRLKSYLILDLNFFSTDWLFYSNHITSKDDFNRLSFFKKYILSVYPDLYDKNYNFYNPSVIYLSNFRKHNFPVLNEIVENNFNREYTISIKDFNKIGNFLLNSKFENNFFKLFMFRV